MEIFLNENLKYINEEIGEIRQNRTYHFLSEGKWSMYNLLGYLLKCSGKAKLGISTFTISEAAIRVLFNCIEGKLISEINCLFDHSVRKNRMDQLRFANSIINGIYLNNNHAKLLLIENESWKIVVNGSANMTSNFRIEAGIICTMPEVYYKYKLKFDEILNKSQKFEL